MSEIRHDWVKAQVGEYIDKPANNENEWITKALVEIQKKGKITNAQDVFVIQNALKGLGYTGTKVDQEFIIDAVFRAKSQKGDSDTMRAIKSFQKEYKIRVDGQIGAKTLAKILEAYAEKQKVPQKQEPISASVAESVPVKKDTTPQSLEKKEDQIVGVQKDVAPVADIPKISVPESPKKPLEPKGFMDGFVDGVNDTANFPLNFLKNK